MAYNKSVHKRTNRRKMRVRSRIVRDAQRPRIVVFRSLKHMYAQVVDNVSGNIVASCSTLQVEASGDKTAIAHAIGKELASRAQNKGVLAAVFDRGQYLYHGRVKALADGLRDGGLII